MRYERCEREQVFNALYDAYYDAVRAYAWRRDRVSADDAVAETFLVAWRRLEEIPDKAQLPWLLGVSRNTILNIQRGERRRRERELREVPAPAPISTDYLDDLGECDPHITRLLRRLPAAEREVLLLVAWEGLDRDAIARVVGCSRANVAVRLHRARCRVRALMEGSALTAPASLLSLGAQDE